MHDVLATVALSFLPTGVVCVIILVAMKLNKEKKA
jgi:hypothetical protein